MEARGTCITNIRRGQREVGILVAKGRALKVWERNGERERASVREKDREKEREGGRERRI